MNRTEVLELRNKRAALAEQARQILADAKDGALNEEQRTAFDKIHADINALGQRVEAEERQAELEASLNLSIREPQRPDVRDARVPESRGDVLAGDQYRDAFRAWVTEPVAGITTEQRSMIHQFRAQGVASAGIGGATVPAGFRAQLMEAMKAFGGIRTSRATILNTEAGNDLPIPTVNETSQTGELIAENTAVTAQDATFSSVTMKAYKYSSKTILVGFELMQDTGIDLTGYIARALGTRLGRITNTHFTTGDNSSKPQGVVSASTAGKTAAAAAAITYLELIDLIHSVDPAHRANAQFMFNDATLVLFKKLVDSEGRPLWLPGVAVGEPDRILGYQYIINQDMASPATTAKTVLFGDFSYYHVRDVMDVTLYRIADKYIEQGSVGFLAYMRTDGRLVNPGSNPIKHLVQA
jgi:HK97 family phage major capsid protein